MVVGEEVVVVVVVVVVDAVLELQLLVGLSLKATGAEVVEIAFVEWVVLDTDTPFSSITLSSLLPASPASSTTGRVAPPTPPVRSALGLRTDERTRSLLGSSFAPSFSDFSACFSAFSITLSVERRETAAKLKFDD